MYSFGNLKSLHYLVKEICSENSVNYEFCAYSKDKDNQVYEDGVIILTYMEKTRKLTYNINSDCIPEPIMFDADIINKVAMAISELKATD